MLFIPVFYRFFFSMETKQTYMKCMENILVKTVWNRGWFKKRKEKRKHIDPDHLRTHPGSEGSLGFRERHQLFFSLHPRQYYLFHGLFPIHSQEQYWYPNQLVIWLLRSCTNPGIWRLQRYRLLHCQDLKRSTISEGRPDNLFCGKECKPQQWNEIGRIFREGCSN